MSNQTVTRESLPREEVLRKYVGGIGLGLWYLCLYARSGTDLRHPLREGASPESLRDLVTSVWTARGDRGAELRLTAADRQALVSIETLQKEPHLEMHTRGG